MQNYTYVLPSSCFIKKHYNAQKALMMQCHAALNIRCIKATFTAYLNR